MLKEKRRYTNNAHFGQKDRCFRLKRTMYSGQEDHLSAQA
jgi:hypothetical protein